MSPIEALALKMHATRREVERLRREMAEFVCLREDKQNGKPCWKATWIPPEYDNSMDAPRMTYRGYWDHAGGNADEGEERSAPWCGPCVMRERLRPLRAAGSRSLGALKAAFWRAAKRLAEGQP